MRARRMIAPSLTGKVGRQLHETRALTGVAMLSPREQRQHVGQMRLILRHGEPPGTARRDTTSLRAYSYGANMRQDPVAEPASLQATAMMGPVAGSACGTPAAP